MKLNLAISGKELSLLLVIAAFIVVCVFVPEKAGLAAQTLLSLVSLYGRK